MLSRRMMLGVVFLAPAPFLGGVLLMQSRWPVALLAPGEQRHPALMPS